MSYPYLWDLNSKRPKDAELAGTYKILKIRLASDLARTIKTEGSRITLESDHTAILSDVPEFDTPGETQVCSASGSATWNEDNTQNAGMGWSVEFTDFSPAKTSTTPGCAHRDLSGLVILGRHAPHRLYQSVGDPDSDTGVEYGIGRD
jgi:hypothetical protein